MQTKNEWFNQSEFRVWYVEASKARIYHYGDDSVALVAQTVLLYVFENILKLLHTFMPFVTEELWQALPNRREALIISSWPQTSLPRSTHLVKRFENLQALTRAIRNARAEYYVEPAKRITASIVGSEEVIQYISHIRKSMLIGCILLMQEEKEVLALLSKLDLDNIHFADCPPGMFTLNDVSTDGLFFSNKLHILLCLLMPAIAYKPLTIYNMCSRQFIEKAPKDVVRGVQEKAAEAE
nr:unnamed protein product [Gossypium raimondii]